MSRSCIFALVGVAVLTAPSAWAHTDPGSASATGVGLSLTAFRNDGTTPVATSGGTVSQCETIKYRATLSALGGDNAAFESGSWRVTTPDGVAHDVTPAGGVPCIGGTTDDPNTIANGGRGLCAGSAANLQTGLIMYTVSLADVVLGKVKARTTYGFQGEAYSHLTAADQQGISASTPFDLTVVTCDDGQICNGVESCDPALVFPAGGGTGLGACVPGTPLDCDDGSACTADSCDPATGCVNSDISGTCDDNDLCTADSCDPDTGCVNSDISGTCDDNDLCTADSCDPANGCVNSDISGTCDDNDLCTADSCDPANGCVNSDISGACDDNNLCTADSCDPATGCVNSDISGACDDSDVCTTDSCDPVLGCVNVDNGSCGEEICRTPGFWGARGGDEKNGENITEFFIRGGFTVCGVPITNTDLNDPNSAIEAICINKSSVGDRKIIRNLTAAMLNCNTSTCSAEIESRIAECNQLCADGLDYGTCAGELDCYNNGDTWDYVEGMCIENFGACFDSGLACSDSDPCVGDEDYCVPEETCHDRNLCPEGADYCFEPPGPASSSGKCNKARKNSLYIGE